jgi:hypothetical protein
MRAAQFAISIISATDDAKRVSATITVQASFSPWRSFVCRLAFDGTETNPSPVAKLFLAMQAFNPLHQ